MAKIFISIKGEGVKEFESDYIKNLRIKSGCGCRLFDYKSRTYKPTATLKQLKAQIENAK